jgi:hypothetical protein
MRLDRNATSASKQDKAEQKQAFSHSVGCGHGDLKMTTSQTHTPGARIQSPIRSSPIRRSTNPENRTRLARHKLINHRLPNVRKPVP